MNGILDTIILILFVVFLIFIIGGFNKQMVQQNKDRKKKTRGIYEKYNKRE
jgi:uncharacterized membrane protein